MNPIVHGASTRLPSTVAFVTVRISGRSVAAAAGVGALVGYMVLFRLGKVSGSTRAERTRALPGDDLIHSPSFVTNHAATLDAPPERVWPWMTQVGWHRAGSLLERHEASELLDRAQARALAGVLHSDPRLRRFLVCRCPEAEPRVDALVACFGPVGSPEITRCTQDVAWEVTYRRLTGVLPVR